MPRRMARPERIGLIFAVIALSVCSARPEPDAARCARIWNDRPGADLSDRFDEAIAYPWTDKAGDDGCGVIFVSGVGGPWVMFGGVVLDGRVGDWSRVEGERWGEDSPEGDVPTESNVVVLPGGLVSVPA